MSNNRYKLLMVDIDGTLIGKDRTISAKDKNALAEAKRMGIPVVAIVDTNCNPETIDYPIPANDDAIRAVKLMCSKIADAVIEGQAGFSEMLAEEDAEAAAPETGEPGESAEPLIFTPED